MFYKFRKLKRNFWNFIKFRLEIQETFPGNAGNFTEKSWKLQPVLQGIEVQKTFSEIQITFTKVYRTGFKFHRTSPEV